jgi:DNA mismatch endonuclease (patch repair protein)
MVDVLTPEQRRLNMSRIRGRGTAPELRIRRGLHAKGLRFRLHRKTLPGTPDLIFPRYQAVVFVHGCFWHGHGCNLSKLPATRPEFWRKKIDGNVARDRKAIMALIESGSRVLVIWECALRGPERQTEEAVMGVAVRFLRKDECACSELTGSSNRDAESPAPGKGCRPLRQRWKPPGRRRVRLRSRQIGPRGA